MLAALIITARESLEASLIVGILLAYVRRTDNRALAGRIWLGAGTAALASLLLAVVIVIGMGDLTGDAKEAVEGVVMLLAIGVSRSGRLARTTRTASTPCFAGRGRCSLQA